MRNWLKARVPSVYERLTGRRPWDTLHASQVPEEPERKASGARRDGRLPPRRRHVVGGRVRGREVAEVGLPDDRQPGQIVRAPQRLGPDARLLESLPIEGHVGHRVPDDRAELGEASGLERFRRLPLERSEQPVLRQAPTAGQPSVKGKHDPRDQPRVHGHASRVPQRMPAVNRPSRRSAGRPRRPRRTPRERRAAPVRARGSRGPRSGRTRRPSRDGRAGRASPSSRPGRRRW